MLTLRFARAIADRVREMVVSEQACCSFLTFVVNETAEEIAVTITAPERARETAALLFAQFIPAGSVTSPVAPRT